MEAMREREKTNMRDQEELEGALLPAAVPIEWNPTEELFLENVATPALVLDKHLSGTANNESQEAFSIPRFVFNTEPKKDKALLQQAERVGARDVEEERRIALRERQRLYAIECVTKEQFQMANRKAREIAEQDERGKLELPELRMARLAEENIQAAKEKQSTVSSFPEVYEGSFGKEYEVRSYDVSNYEIEEYDVVNYKSLYEP
ncbi:hypothetical protein MPSEU_000564200 [Mayamaea pseudoterrestris]|nr:hypothetical protein MPSEU_000564200 [Mayamaea pseudoterrestris]